MTFHMRLDLMKEVKIPIDLFEFRLLSAAELIVYYLTYSTKLRQHEISFLLKRNPRTIWTWLTRAESKISEARAKEPKIVKFWESKCGIDYEMPKLMEAAP